MRLSVQHVHFTRQVDSFVGPFWKQFLTTTYGRLFLFQALRLASLEVYYIANSLTIAIYSNCNNNVMIVGKVISNVLSTRTDTVYLKYLFPDFTKDHIYE